MEPSAAHQPDRFGCGPAAKCRSPAGVGVAVGSGANLPDTRPIAAVGPFMSRQDVQPPDLFPILAPGKHRDPCTGACFMELASLLAGERWSDHPACTHPLLAALARHVNDHTSDAGRQRLADLIPSVIGRPARIWTRNRMEVERPADRARSVSSPVELAANVRRHRWRTCAYSVLRSIAWAMARMPVSFGCTPSPLLYSGRIRSGSVGSANTRSRSTTAS